MKKSIIITTLFLMASPLASCGNGGGGGEAFDEEKAKNLIISCKANSIASTYKYNYRVSASLKLPPLFKDLSASISGDILYNGTQYLQKRVNSGPLLVDSTTYTFNQGNDLIKINTRKDDFEVVNKENYSPSYDFETNSVGKIFKSLVKDEFLEIKDDKTNAHKFSVSLGHTSFKNKFLSVLNFIDLTPVLNILNKISEEKWGTTFKPTCYFILDEQNTYVKNFHVELNLDFKNIATVTFALDQNFSQVGGTFDIKIPDVLKDCYLTSDAIDTNLATLKPIFNTAKEHYYEYTLKTAVDHGIAKGNPLGLAVNSTTKGFSERKQESGKFYFHNELEVDSDYKNDDQYGKDVIEDYEYTRARISRDNSVWDVKDRAIGKERNKVENYNNDAVDDYYMMPKSEWLSSSYVKALRRTTNTKDKTITWKLGLSGDAIKEILETYNKAIRLDREGIEWIDVYEIDSNFNAKNFEFNIITNNNNQIDSINIDGKGSYTMKTNKIMKEKEDVKFKFELTIDKFNYSKDYEIPENETDIDAKI